MSSMDPEALKLQLRSLNICIEVTRLPLEALYFYVQGKVPISEVHFKALFTGYGKSTFLYDQLEHCPINDKKQKNMLNSLMDDLMNNKALHEVLYELKKDEMSAQLKAVCEESIGFFENPEANIGNRLNVERDPDREHPIDELLHRRDNVAELFIAIRYLQAEDFYPSVKIADYERRMKIADMTLKRKLLECVFYHYKDYRETWAFAPKEYWWRHLRGHEYIPEDEKNK